MSVRIGVTPALLPQVGGDGLFFRFVDLSDELGLDSVWLPDVPVGRFPFLDAAVGLAAVAARSDRLKFGPSVFNLATRAPVHAAKTLASLDYVSGGRCFPAIGLGLADLREYEACAIEKSERAARVEEAIPLLRRLWTEESVDHEGRFYRLRDVTVEPKPVQRPYPIWLGGHTTAAQRRVGRLGDGWLAAELGPDEMRRGVEVIFSSAAEAGRTIAEDHIGIVLGFRIGRSRDAARRAAEPFALRARPARALEEQTAVGDVEDVAACIQEYVAAGVSKFVLRPMCSPDEMLDQLRVLGEEIVPRFHGRPSEM